MTFSEFEKLIKTHFKETISFHNLTVIEGKEKYTAVVLIDGKSRAIFLAKRAKDWMIYIDVQPEEKTIVEINDTPEKALTNLLTRRSDTSRHPTRRQP